MLIENEKILSSKRIGIFGKDGSGKSTIAALSAKSLRETGYEVGVLDADSTNIGVPQALGADSPAPLIDYYGGMIFSGGAVTCPVDDPTPLAAANIPLDDLPPAYLSYSPEGIHLFVAGKIGDKGPGAGCDGPVAKIARDFRPCFTGEPPVTVVDFKAGFEDLARGNIATLDWIVVVVDPTAAAVQMAINVRDTVDRLKAGGMPATAHLDHPDLIEWAYKLYREARVRDSLFVLNKVRDEETETYLRRRLAEHDIEPIGVIYDDPSLSLAWLQGKPLAEVKTKTEVERIVEAIETAEKVCAP